MLPGPVLQGLFWSSEPAAAKTTLQDAALVRTQGPLVAVGWVRHHRHQLATRLGAGVAAGSSASSAWTRRRRIAASTRSAGAVLDSSAPTAAKATRQCAALASTQGPLVAVGLVRHHRHQHHQIPSSPSPTPAPTPAPTPLPPNTLGCTATPAGTRWNPDILCYREPDCANGGLCCNAGGKTNEYKFCGVGSCGDCP
ncbi:unnamed protein product [Prorocentrum cordatum]|uniref:WAP domain-containing protein n=1 Tax=Prorocentrum cordatum TaxID=2364126 RepID=A0ABN9Y4D7_9DINO|nr:unnamed protein product [Polarella glacialis]